MGVFDMELHIHAVRYWTNSSTQYIPQVHKQPFVAPRALDLSGG